MRSPERLAVAIILGLVVLVGGTTAAAAYAWHRAGTVRIAVHESGPGGSDIALAIPGLLVEGAIALCPIPDDPRLKARLHELGPVIRSVADRLGTLPDVVLVDIHDRGETVHVEKSGDALLIRVDSAEARVSLAVPIASVRRIAHKLDTWGAGGPLPGA